MTDKLQFAIISCLILLFIGATVISTNKQESKHITPQASPQLDNSQITVTTQTVDTLKLYNLINGYRKENELSELKIHTALEQSARLKIQDMITAEYWRHEDPQNTQSWYLFNQAGYNYVLAGENLAFSLNTAWAVFDGWVQSPRHRQELLTKEYQDMGIAADCDTYKQENQPSCITVLHLGAD